MQIVKQTLIGLFSIVFLLGGLELFTPIGSEAEAGGWYKKKSKRVTNKDLARGQDDLEDKINMLKDSTEVLEQNQTMMKEDIATILEKLMNGGGSEGGFPCTEEGGTPVGDRWVVSASGLTVCDRDHGNTWEQRPLATTRTWQEGLDYCPTSGPG